MAKISCITAHSCMQLHDLICTDLGLHDRRKHAHRSESPGELSGVRPLWLHRAMHLQRERAACADHGRAKRAACRAKGTRSSTQQFKAVSSNGNPRTWGARTR